VSRKRGNSDGEYTQQADVDPRSHHMAFTTGITHHNISSLHFTCITATRTA